MLEPAAMPPSRTPARTVDTAHAGSYGDPALQALRVRIDEIDAQILTLVLARSAVVCEVADEKARLSLPVRDPQREQEHLAALLATAERQGASPDFSEVVRDVFVGIFAASRALQER